MDITSRQSPAGPVEVTGQVRSHLLHSGAGAERSEGDVVLLELPPDCGHTVPTRPRESGTVLLDGAVDVLIDGDVRPLDVGAIVQTAGATDLRLRTTERPATMLSIYGAPGGPGDPAPDEPAGIRIAWMDDVAEVPLHSPEHGFFHMHARMMIDQANGRPGAFTLGQGTFAPGGGSHALHRHPNAAEVFYVWSGDGVQLTEDGAEHPLHPGDLVYVPAGEWHGFRNTGPTPVRAVFGYLGANSLERAGYELPDPG